MYKQGTHLKKQPFNCNSIARHYTRGRTLFMESVTRIKNPKSVEKVLQLSNEYPRIKITYKLPLRCINTHRPGIQVDRCCPQSKMLAPSENDSDDDHVTVTTIMVMMVTIFNCKHVHHQKINVVLSVLF